MQTMSQCTKYSLVPRPPPAFFEFMKILQAIKAGDKAGDEATRNIHQVMHLDDIFIHSWRGALPNELVEVLVHVLKH